LAVAIVAGLAWPARAEPGPTSPSLTWPPPGGDDTFRYLEPQGSHPARAAGWIGLDLALHMASYLLTSRPPGPIYQTVYTPWEKLAHGAISFDSNTFRTNFVGHPLMGGTMYQLARGSRVGAWQASLAAVAGSTGWELIEFHEKASINDLVVTPVAGIALGEPLFQLAAHLDRAPPSATSTVLAWLTAPWKKINDAIDGAHPARGQSDDTLEVRFAAGVETASTASGRRDDVRWGGGWRLWRDTDYGAPGHATSTWLDGQATGLEASLSAGRRGVSDAWLHSSALLAAVFVRAIEVDGRGVDLVAGLGPGFELRGHAWSRSGPFDFAGLVELPHGAVQGRWLAGPTRLTMRLEAALLFGGSRSFALDGDPGAAPFDTLPTGQQQFGYHFGLGGSLRPSIELVHGPATVSARWRADSLGGLGNPDPFPGHHPTASLAERWQEAALRVAWRFGGWLAVEAGTGWRRRWSRADDTTRTASERSWSLTAAVNP
jgi:hypothetical protein